MDRVGLANTLAVLFIVLLTLLGWRPTAVEAQSVPFGAISFTGRGVTNQASNSLLTTHITNYRYVSRYVVNTYTSSGGSASTILGQVASGSTSYALVDGLTSPALDDAAGGESLTAVPLFVVPVACIYNLPYAVNSTATTLLQLNGAVLADIFTGVITHWNDSAILALNPSSSYAYSSQLASLDEEIRVVVRTDASLTTEAFTRFMADRSASFASSVGVSTLPDWGGVPSLTANSESNMRSTVASNDYSIGFILWSSYLSDSSGVGYSRMRNRAGTNPSVVPSLTTAGALSLGNVAQFDTSRGLLIANLTDSGSANTWPIAYYTYVVLRTSTSTSCEAQQELTRWLGWLYSNAQVSTLSWQSGYAIPHFGVVKRVMDALGSVQCNSSVAMPTRYILGSGATLPALAMQWWMNLYERRTTDVMMSYTSEGSTAGKNNIRGTAAGPNTDFGASDAPLTAAEYQGTGADLQMLPALAAAVVYIYNVPELTGKPRLVLSREVAADIYLGNITHWDDPAIVAINPEHADVLPHQEIKVVGRSDGSGTTDIFTSALSRFSATFSETVGPSELVNWGNSGSVAAPAKNLIPNSRYLTGSGTSGVVNAVRNNAYAVGYAVSADAIANNLAYANMINKAGFNVSASGTSIRSALIDYAGSFTERFTSDVTDGSGDSTWPITGYSYYIVRKTSMINCDKAQVMLDFILWTQSNSDPIDAADALGYSVTPIGVRRQFLIKLSEITCNSEPIFSFVPCLQNGVVCSDHGTCLNSQCICEDGWTGSICQTAVVNTTSSDSDVTAIAVGVAVPLGILLLCCLVAAWLITLFVIKRRGSSRSGTMDWVIPYTELDVGDMIAIGGYGEVRKAEWKGSTVAIKMLASREVTKDVQEAFIDEMQVMMNLRHPNILLFMGAVIKPPHMCIVMEYMEIGSLYDVVHNELLSDDVFTLPKRLRIASEACKGLHFLHATGICHRDLKSMNVLLDSNWNVKIGDFGLTKFKSKMGEKRGSGKEEGNDALPSVHWTAPEVLENPDTFSKASDIYSFGIILWELITRQDPYEGMSPTTITVKVMRDNLRPIIPESCPEDLNSLITVCWSQDPMDRPDCTEVTSRLQTMYRHGSSRSGQSSGSSSNVYFAEGFDAFAMERSHMSRASTDSAMSPRVEMAKTKAPQGIIAIVFTDVAKASALWEFAPTAMRDATILHNQCIRSTMQKYGGYEVTISKEGGEGSFCITFQDVITAVKWAALLQEELMKLDWPPHLLTHPAAAEEWDAQDTPIFKGLRVRIGVHYGEPRALQDPLTKRIEYIGPHMSLAAHVTTLAKGGQVLLSNEAYSECKSKAELQELGSFISAGRFDISNTTVTLYEYRPMAFATRFVGETGSLRMDGMSSGNIDAINTPSQDIRAISEDSTSYLTSANLCRWIINFNQIQLGKQIGMGTYGLVYSAKWKGVDVAVKKFIKQKMNERRMLEIRAEAALLSELHHPHIVMFIGACMKQPNLCIVTEYMQRGNLRDVLRDKTVIMPWVMRMTIAKSIGLALRYLHTLEPVIIHRDLKSSNILVDENWTVKVGDFGFARLREENATMTRCGTPCWTAPEVLRGEEYNEKADIYSFGMIIWELLTRAVPYEDQNFIGVTMEVLKGVRPKIPPKTDPQLELLIMECWDDDPKKRPKLTKLLRYFATALNEPENDV